MYLKNIIICLLLNFVTADAVNEKTKQHMLACYNELKDGKSPKKFEQLLKLDDFYKYHLEDPFTIPDTATTVSFGDALFSLIKKTKKFSTMPTLVSLRLKAVNTKLYPLDIDTYDTTKKTFLHLSKCYTAIEDHNVSKLHELLKQDEFYKKHIGEPFQVLLNNDVIEHNKNLLQVAIEHLDPRSIRLVAYLQHEANKEKAFSGYLNQLLNRIITNLQENKPVCFRFDRDLLSLTRMLIENKCASATEIDPINGETPLHRNWDAATAQYLIQMGADVNARDSKGITPLLVACTRLFNPYSTSNLVCLLNHDAYINKKYERDVSDFYAATLNAEVPLPHIKILLDYDGDPSIKDDDGKSVIDKLKASTCSSAPERKRLIQDYPRIALISKSFNIDPFKYCQDFDVQNFNAQHSNVNTQQLLAHRELTGKKHSYTGYKKKNLGKHSGLFELS